MDKKLFTESEFKKLSIKHLQNIANARINEIIDYIFNKNKNLTYLNNKISRLHLFFDDQEILESIGHLFEKSLKIKKRKKPKLNYYL